MARVKRGVTAKAKHKKILKMAKGYRGRNKNVFRIALEKVEKALQYSYRDRKVKKRDFRSLWITRINAGLNMHDVSYSKFISGLKSAGIELNRKMLAHIAYTDKDAFANIVDRVKKSLK